MDLFGAFMLGAASTLAIVCCIGYMASKEDSSNNDISHLKNKMQDAVENEDYETAAQLRDKINEKLRA